MDALVSGRVDRSVKDRADFYIRKSGLTTSEVIRIVWANIAETGRVPEPHGEGGPDDLVGRMRGLRAEFSFSNEPVAFEFDSSALEPGSHD